MSYLQTADSALSTMQSMVKRIRTLTEKAVNGTYGDEERRAMQTEADTLIDELFRVKNTTEVNRKKVFDENLTERYVAEQKLAPANIKLAKNFTNYNKDY